MLLTVVVLVLVVVVFLIYLWLTSENNSAKNHPEVLSSGNYSIVRISPRRDVYSRRPTIEQVENYLKEKGKPIELAKRFFDILEYNISVIEEGDKRGVEFFVFEDENCNEEIKNMYIGRKDIAKNSDMIPPYHIENQCKLRGEFNIEAIEKKTRLDSIDIKWDKEFY